MAEIVKMHLEWTLNFLQIYRSDRAALFTELLRGRRNNARTARQTMPGMMRIASDRNLSTVSKRARGTAVASLSPLINPSSPP